MHYLAQLYWCNVDLTARDYTPSPSLPSVTLRVAEVTQNSVRLGWNLVADATGYILRWREETGRAWSYTIKTVKCILSGGAHHFNCSQMLDKACLLRFPLPPVLIKWLSYVWVSNTDLLWCPLLNVDLDRRAMWMNAQVTSMCSFILTKPKSIFLNILLLSTLLNFSVCSLCGWASGRGVFGACIYWSDQPGKTSASTPH